MVFLTILASAPGIVRLESLPTASVLVFVDDPRRVAHDLDMVRKRFLDHRSRMHDRSLANRDPFADDGPRADADLIAYRDTALFKRFVGRNPARTIERVKIGIQQRGVLDHHGVADVDRKSAGKPSGNQNSILADGDCRFRIMGVQGHHIDPCARNAVNRAPFTNSNAARAFDRKPARQVQTAFDGYPSVAIGMQQRVDLSAQAAEQMVQWVPKCFRLQLDVPSQAAAFLHRA